MLNTHKLLPPAALLLCLPLTLPEAQAQSSLQPSMRVAQASLPNAPSAHLAADLHTDTSIYQPAGPQQLPTAQASTAQIQTPATSAAHNTPSATDESVE